MKTGLSGVWMGVLVATSCVACTVKENRDSCPCRLLLDFSEVDTAVIRSVNVRATSPDGLVFSTQLPYAVLDGEYEIGLPRGDMNLNVSYGAAEYCMQGTELLIPYGEESPQFYVYAERIDTRREWLRRKVVMRKNHCLMTIRVKDDSDFPFELEVKGNVCGFDEIGDPKSGDFSCRAPGNAEEGFMVVVPRQLDRSLELCVRENEGLSRTFALGEYMAASGYDWTQDVLDDVTVWLDYCLTHVMITIRTWEGDFSYDVVI